MKALILLLFVSLNVMAKDTMITKEKMKRIKESKELKAYKASGKIRVDKSGVLWNSVNKGLEAQIFCTFSRKMKKRKIIETLANLGYCYEVSSWNHTDSSAAAKYFGVGKYKIISRAKISYNAQTCDLLMGKEVIGKYYGGHCLMLYERMDGSTGKMFDQGIEVLNASITIDEINKEIIID